MAKVNPCTIKGAGVEPADERLIPTVTEVHALAAAIDLRFRCVVLVAAFIGLRKGEMLGLRRCDVDLEGRAIAVVQQRQLDAAGNHLVGPPKTDAGRRTIAIPAAVVDDLRHHLETYAQAGNEGYVFSGEKGGPLAPHVLQKHWAQARVAVGVEHLHLHDLRHLAGTLAATTGAGTKELMYRLGHASPQAASATSTPPRLGTSPSSTRWMRSSPSGPPTGPRSGPPRPIRKVTLGSRGPESERVPIGSAGWM